MRTPTFYLLWIEFVCGAMAGLMVIGTLPRLSPFNPTMSFKQGSCSLHSWRSSMPGPSHCRGCIRLHRQNEDHIARFHHPGCCDVILCQDLVVYRLYHRICRVGFSYGSCLSLFPSTTADHWGTKNLGLNYGIMFTAWGVGGVFGPILAGKVADATGTYSTAYVICAGLLIFAAISPSLQRPCEGNRRSPAGCSCCEVGHSTPHDLAPTPVILKRPSRGLFFSPDII